PRIENDSIECQLDLTVDNAPDKIRLKRHAQVSLPPGAVALWTASDGIVPGIASGPYQLIVLRRQKRNSEANRVTTAVNDSPKEVPASDTSPLLKLLKESNLMRDARQLFDAGKLDQAEAKAKEALSENSKNQAAIELLKVINDAATKAATDSPGLPPEGRQA